MTRSRDLSTLFESVFDHAPIGMSLLDLGWHRVRVNDAFCQLLGRSRTELLGTHIAEGMHPDDVAIGSEEPARLLSGEIKSYQVQKRYLHAWGYPVWVLITVSLIRDEAGAPLYFVAQVQNIAQQKAREERLEHMVDHDFLTGLFNRRYFDRALEHELDRSRRYGPGGVLLLADIDHFKEVNDRFGHAAGDDLLKSVAATLKQHVRRTDVLARFGGDEFAILLPETSIRDAQQVAEGLVKALRRQASIFGQDGVQVTASIGMAPLDGTAEQSLSSVDRAMYEAKKAGRDRFAVWTGAALPALVTPQKRIEHSRVRETFESDRLCLYAQPIVDLTTGETTQYELLLRVRGRAGDPPMLPAAFLGTAERAGIIQSIDAWVVREAVKLLSQGPLKGKATFNVNISGQSVGSAEFAALVEGVLDRYAVDPSRLVFELTETAAISDIDQARTFARRMRELGCQIALDDFGAGFGSFQNLKHLPFDVLKIDGEFVRDLTAGTVDQVVVKAIVGISRDLQKKTVAEFIESAAMADFLRENGVDCGQGYFLGEPQPVTSLMLAAVKGVPIPATLQRPAHAMPTHLAG